MDAMFISEKSKPKIGLGLDSTNGNFPFEESINVPRNHSTLDLPPVSQSSNLYYKFNSPVKENGIYVLDADHGVFDYSSKGQQVRLKNKLKKMFKKSSDSDNFQQTNFITQSSDFGLRPEPELVSSNRIHRMYNNEIPVKNIKSLNNTERDSIIVSDSMNSHTHLRRARMSSHKTSHSSSGKPDQASTEPTKGLANWELSPSQRIPSLGSSIGKQRDDEMFEDNQLALQETLNRIPQLQLAYQKMKLKADRYRNERDQLKLNNDMEHMRKNIKDYQYYCVNGLNPEERNKRKGSDLRRPNHNAMGYISNGFRDELSYEDNGFNIRSTTTSSRYLKNGRPMKFITSEGTKANEFTTKTKAKSKMKAKSYENDVVTLLKSINDQIPSNKDMKNFHSLTMDTVKNLPFGSLFAPVFTLLTPFLAESFGSYIGLLICTLDVVVLLLYASLIYHIWSTVYPILRGFLKLLKLFGIGT